MKKEFSQKKGIADAVNGLQVLLAAIVFFGLMGLVGGVLGLIQDDIAPELLEANVTGFTVTNQTTGGINATGFTVPQGTSLNSSNGNFVKVSAFDRNGTGFGFNITNNVSMTSAGVVTNTTSPGFGSNATISFTYDNTRNLPTQGYYNLQNATAGQGNIFERLGLIGTVIVLVFILILILGVVGYFLAGKYGSNQFS